MKMPVRCLLVVSAILFLSVRAECSVPGYRQYLDSAATYMSEKKFREATHSYYNGLNAYREHYRTEIDSINRQLAAEYEIDRKEHVLEQLNETLRLRRMHTILFSIFIVVLLVALILLFFIQKYRLRVINQKGLRKENETTLLKLERDKKELEARLHILQAAKYQKELLAGNMLVEYKNQTMEDLRLFFDSHPALDKYKPVLEKIMTDIPGTDNNQPDTRICEVSPAFNARLQERADNKLTALDLKYCRMIYLNMSSKEMADILQVDPKTIRVTKYRLKQKLGLGKDDDLAGVITEIL